MKWSLKRWWRRYQAQRQARQILTELSQQHPLTPCQCRELLSLHAFFYPEKMARWPERVTLYRLAAGLPQGACIVEIGAWVGVGTAYLSCGLRSGAGGHLYAVDTFTGTTLNPQTQEGWQRTVTQMGGSTLLRWHANLQAFGLEELVTPLVRDSITAARQWSGLPIDLLFIDGDHVYEAVKQDYQSWAPYVKPEGLIVFHDYDERHPGVQALVNEILAGELAGHATEQVDSLLVIRR